MGTIGNKGGGVDALSSLLSDLDGVEGSIFSRPKTLDGMKKTKPTPPSSQGGRSSTGGAGSAVPSASASPLPGRSPMGSSANLDNLTANSQSVDVLEDIMRPKVAHVPEPAP